MIISKSMFIKDLQDIYLVLVFNTYKMAKKPLQILHLEIKTNQTGKAHGILPSYFTVC